MKHKPRREAVIVDCPGIVNDGVYGHSMRDHCWSCAPFWATFPVCPDGHGKLTTTGYCKQCRKHFHISK